jgi:D-beta-D-heptose 7-phosphate kinase/D-beta-D-heptose 1-phosphate adenosyltransferase
MLKPDPGSNGILQIVTFGMPGPVMNLPMLRSQIPPGARVVLTNGVFDLLHVGHLRYLRAARALGDVLVVGVNADVSVRKAGRPLIPETERAELVAALDPVDYVVIFSEPTALSLVRELRPSVYAKGADYAEKPLPEADAAREVGAQVVLIPLVPDHSTTRLAELLRNAPG